MKQFLSGIRASLGLVLIFTAVCCGLYPFLVFGVGRLAFPVQAGGSLIRDERGVVLGSSLIGQAFTNASYFHSRPSAAGTGHDAASSGGSNLGPTSRLLHRTIAVRITALRTENGLPDGAFVPADAVTASASGLDPHISPSSAFLQARRVAAVRGMPVSDVEALVAACTEPPQLAFLGEPRVNVLRVNLKLDLANKTR